MLAGVARIGRNRGAPVTRKGTISVFTKEKLVTIAGVSHDAIHKMKAAGGKIACWFEKCYDLRNGDE